MGKLTTYDTSNMDAATRAHMLAELDRMNSQAQALGATTTQISLHNPHRMNPSDFSFQAFRANQLIIDQNFTNPAKEQS